METMVISLTQSKVAIVDAIDYPWLSRWKWFAVKGRAKSNPTFYACRNSSSSGPDSRRMISMHSQIIGKIRVDHADGNGLNNSRSNLRPATHSQNSCNRRRRSDNMSGFKGVYFKKDVKAWRATIQVNGQRIVIGHFPTSEQAGRAYDAAALKYHGSFARLNFPR